MNAADVQDSGLQCGMVGGGSGDLRNVNTSFIRQLTLHRLSLSMILTAVLFHLFLNISDISLNQASADHLLWDVLS